MFKGKVTIQNQKAMLRTRSHRKVIIQIQMVMLKTRSKKIVFSTKSKLCVLFFKGKGIKWEKKHENN